MSEDGGRGREDERVPPDEEVEFPGRSPTASLRIALILAVALILLVIVTMALEFI